MIIEPTTRWLPQNAADREMVRHEMNAIISSHHFRNSKRYPALLKYVVDKTLDGCADQLKERTLGIEVFDRPPDYDTNADPVVRFTAGEIRKRIAQYYHENGKCSRLQIDLPLGCYVPEFTFRPVDPAEAYGEEKVALELSEPQSLTGTSDIQQGRVHSSADDLHMPGAGGKLTRHRIIKYGRRAAMLLTAVACVGLYIAHRATQPTLSEKMWGPLLKEPGSILFVVGNGPRGLFSSTSQSEQVNAANPPHGAYNHISFNEAVSLSRLADVLVKHSKPYQVKEADLATLQDMRDRPVVLIGAYNNNWTMRLTAAMRFHFEKDNLIVRIVDAGDPSNRDWAVDYTKPYSAALYDYAIVARYVDPTTSGEILIVAGIGAYGTEAASGAAATPQAVDNLLAGLPAGWESKNLEMVVKTAIINGEAGPPTLVGSTTW